MFTFIANVHVHIKCLCLSKSRKQEGGECENNLLCKCHHWWRTQEPPPPHRWRMQVPNQKHSVSAPCVHKDCVRPLWRVVQNETIFIWSQYTLVYRTHNFCSTYKKSAAYVGSAGRRIMPI